MTPMVTPVLSAIAVRSRTADASGSSGSRTTVSGPLAFEASTPADAQTKPCRVSVMTSGGRARTTSRVSRRMTSMRRGSPSPASSCARSDGSTSRRSTTRPSDLRDRLLRDHEDVPGLEPSHALGRVDEQCGEIVAGLELRDAREPDHPHLAGHGRPVILIPACPR